MAPLHAWGCAAIGLVLACRPADEFTCSSDAQCVQGSQAGTCEPTGFCSFPDATCPSGQRYGGLAGDGLAGMCVGEGETEAPTTGSSGPEPTTSPTTVDPSTSATTVIPGTESSTGDPPLPFCGDGDLDEGEACDDGNDEPGDGCNPDCVASGTIMCAATSDDLSGNSYGMGIAWVDDGMVMAGWAETMLGEDILLRSYDAGCGQQWTTTYDDGADERSNGVAFEGESRMIWVAGQQLTAMGDSARLVAMFDEMGQPAAVDMRPPGAAHALTVRAGVGAVVVGHAGDGPTTAVMWAANYAPDGLFSGEVMSDAMEIDRARALVMDDALAVYVAGNRGQNMLSMADLVVDEVTPMGFTEILRVPGKFQLAEGQAIVLGEAGDLFVAGFVQLPDVRMGFTARDAYIARYTVAGDFVWADVYGTANEAYSDEIEALAIAANGDVVAAGFLNAGTLEDHDIWLRRYTADGDHRWEATYDHEALGDLARGIAIGPDGQLAVAAEVQTTDGIKQAWVAVFSP